MNVNDVLKACMDIDGSTAVALVDYNSGMTLGTAGGSAEINIDMAAAGNTEVVRAKMRTIADLGLNEEIEDILFTLEHTFQLTRVLRGRDGLFLYLVLDKQRANLAMARYRLVELEKQLVI